MQNTPDNEKLVVMSASIPRAMLDDLDRIAEDHGVGRSAVLRWAIMDYLTREALSNG